MASSKLYANFVKKGQVKQYELGDDFKGSRTTFTDGLLQRTEIEENNHQEVNDDIDESYKSSSRYKIAKKAWKDAESAVHEAEAVLGAAVIARNEAKDVYLALKNERKLKKRKIDVNEDVEKE
jgi:uncharacterized membrane protein YhiD involved in acid resistance